MRQRNTSVVNTGQTLPTTGRRQVDELGLDAMDEQIRAKLQQRGKQQQQQQQSSSSSSSKGGSADYGDINKNRRRHRNTTTSVHVERRRQNGVAAVAGEGGGCGLLIMAYVILVVALIGFLFIVISFASGGRKSNHEFFVEGATALRTATKASSPSPTRSGKQQGSRPQSQNLPFSKQQEDEPSFPAIFSTAKTSPVSLDEWQKLLTLGVADVLDLLRVECDSTARGGGGDDKKGQEQDKAQKCKVDVLVHGPVDLVTASSVNNNITRSSMTTTNSHNPRKVDGYGSDLFTSFLSKLKYNDEFTQQWVEPRRRQKEFFELEQQQHQHQQQRRSLAQVQNGNSYSHIFGRECFLDYDGMISWIEDLVANPPSHLTISWTDIGDSYTKTIGGPNSGYDIHVLQIDLADGYLHDNSSIDETSNGVEEKAPMLIVSSTHPREYAPPELVRRWIERIAEEDPPSPATVSFLQHTTIHWVPYLNPDGRVLAETSQPLRRKNLNLEQSGSTRCGSDSYGVDLNRNFPVAWYVNGGSSSFACSQLNHGNGPASEPESQALIAYAQSIFPKEQQSQSLYNFWPTLDNIYDSRLDSWSGYDEATASGVFVDVHSYGQVFVFPYGFGNKLAPNDDSFQAAIGKLEGITGSTAKGPSTSFYGAASGATDDWGYGAMGALSMTWEVGTAFAEQCSGFDASLEASLNAFTFLANIAPRPFSLSKGPDVITFDVSPVVEVPSARSNAVSTSLDSGMSLSLFIEVSDSQKQAIGQATSAQQEVIEVRLYSDINPVASLLHNQTVESYKSFSANELTSSGETSSISVVLTWDELFFGLFGAVGGEHILCAQALDSDGYLGPVAVASIYINATADTNYTATASTNYTEEESSLSNFSAAPAQRAFVQSTSAAASCSWMTLMWALSFSTFALLRLL